jgi:TolB-like protein/Tfp pilus assembly protein PilF
MKPASGSFEQVEGGPTIFLSYARGDAKRAAPVIAAFQKAGINVWWDGLLEGGEKFLPTTEAALESADAVVVLWSRTSVESNWVRDEATRGRDRQCLVPLSLDGSHPPLGFRQFQVIDISKRRAEGLGAAVRAVAALAGRPPPPVPPGSGARFSRRGLVNGAGSAALAAAGGWLAWRGLGPGGSADNTIAVIPFSNLGDADTAYFSAGLSEELRATLARNRLLRISAPTSSAEFRDAAGDVLTIARKLGVAHVLRGSVRHGSDRIRVTVELLSGKDASLDWTQSLDRKPSDVLGLQIEIAAIVSKALAAEINAQAIAEGRSGDLRQIGGTSNAAAFDAYLRGKALADASETEATDREALAKFDAAIALDPKYASALAARSMSLAVIANVTGRSADIRPFFDRAVASAEAAIKHAPDLAEAHSALGYTLYNGRLDPRTARAPYDRSRELGSGDADVLRTFAVFCAFTGRDGDAAEAIATSLSLDPLNPGVFRASGYIAFVRRDYAETIAQMQKALALNPKLSTAQGAIGSALYLLGRNGEAAAAFAAEPIGIIKLHGLAIVHHKTGNKTAAEQALGKLRADYPDSSYYQQAQVLAQWGDRAAALDALGRAASARDPGLLLAQTDPMLDPVRGDPRFGELLSRMGLA